MVDFIIMGEGGIGTQTNRKTDRYINTMTRRDLETRQSENLFVSPSKGPGIQKSLSLVSD